METPTMVELRRSFTTRLLLPVKPVALELPTATAKTSTLRTGTTPPPPITTATQTTTTTTTTTTPQRRRRSVSISIASLFLLKQQQQLVPPPSRAEEGNRKFSELEDSGGVKALDLRIGDGPSSPQDGDEVAIHYYGRLAAKQGWRFDSTYDHKDASGDPLPFVFTLGSGKVIPGIEAAVRSMNVGGIRRVIIPPSQGYQSTTQEPIPPNFFDRQRLFTTIFNPTRLANGEGSTLGTLIFDIELVTLGHRHY